MTTASIVTYKTSRAELERVLESALGENLKRLYIIDHSPDDSLKSYLPDDSQIEYVKRPNLGYGAGHNFAIRKAMELGAEYHAVLNPDIYWEGEVIRGLAEFMDLHRDVGQMLPKVLYPDGRLQYTCKLIPTPFDLIASRFLPERFVSRRLKRYRLADTGYRTIMDVPYMHGCFMMLRIETLKDVGGFDERFFMYPEDIDLTRRIHEKWRTLFYPALTIYHAHAAASRTSARMLRIHILNMIKYFNKWGWIFDRKRRYYNRRLLSEISVDSLGSLSAGTHGKDNRSGTRDCIPSGKDTGA